MHFIILFGPPAVGKMTVGRELEKLTGLKLFHNHMTIELLLPFFECGGPEFDRLISHFRIEIFKSVAKSNLKGLIFTYVWCLDPATDKKFIGKISRIFEKQGAKVYYVELEADLHTRLKRNKHPDRLKEKASKRNLKLSEKRLLDDEKKYRMNSLPGEIRKKNYLKINNAQINAAEVAQMIKKQFKL
ncbi:MAG: AAA family ATPase [Candidatus Yonathbacteria bacterium]|nr:AAA family ATPase [Candidatus Yonathbacteria bacterium]